MAASATSGRRGPIGEQLCRVFGMRFYRSRTTNALTLELLPDASLQGWAALERLQWNLDLHRADVSSRELTLVQALIEDLLRIKARQYTAELHVVDEYLPGAARQFLPRALRAESLEQAKYAGLQRLTDSARL